VEAIRRLCGEEVRYLWLVRHPLDVLVSTRELFEKMGVYPFEFHDYVQRYPAPMEAIAHAWADTNAEAERLAEARPDLVVRLRYEDLVADPVSALKGVFSALGLETDTPALVDRAMGADVRIGLGDWKTYERPQIDATSVSRWKELPEPLVARIAAVVRPLAERLGYHDLPLDPVRPPRHYRRQYQLGRMVAQLKARRG
jgi:hypothetical protein